MINSSLQLQVGDRIFARRPIYNGSDELVPSDKLFRPYIILDINDDNLLVVLLTTNSNRIHTVQINYRSYVQTDDLYIINYSDVIGVDFSLSEDFMNNIFEHCYRALLTYKVGYSDEVKQAFLEAYAKRKKRICPHSDKWQKRDIIYQNLIENKKYVVDQVVDEGYLAYRVNIENNNDINIDFSSYIKLFNDEQFCFYAKVDEQEYQKKQEVYLLEKTPKVVKHNNLLGLLEDGFILEQNGVGYFVIGRTRTNRFISIPYKGNYWLDQIKYIERNKDVKFVRKLDNKEILEIMKAILCNLDVQNNNYIQNVISAKIKKL